MRIVSENRYFYSDFSKLHIAGPGTAPNDLNGTAENTTAITLSWKYPIEPNGVITHYQLQCTGTGRGETLHHSVNSPQTTTTLSGLLPYTNYSCSITAHTSVGGGPAATTNILTKQDGKKCCRKYMSDSLL